MNKAKASKAGALAMILLGLSVLPACAQPVRTPGIDRKQEQQEDRINQGVRDGRLTQQEARQLRDMQDDIYAYERDVKRDGHVSPHERDELRRMQERLDRALDNKLYNGRQRY